MAHIRDVFQLFIIDAKSGYTFNLETYVGTQPEGPFRLAGTVGTLMMVLSDSRSENQNTEEDPPQ
nr:unnamed protein product [Callosobruchus analis]